MQRDEVCEALFAEPKVQVDRRPDGTVYLTSPEPLGAYPDRIGEHLYHWAEKDPDAALLAERDEEGGWRYLSYGRAASDVEAVAQILLGQGLGPERPLMILSGNSINTAVLIMAAMHVGIPAAPVSPAYSLMSRDHGKLRHIRDLLNPGMIYAADAEPFGPALKAVRTAGVPVATADGRGADFSFDTLRGTRPTGAVRDAFRRVGPDTVAKILFTSGSTGLPKGVINTQRMLCSNQQALAQIWPILEGERPVILDWLPWNHTFGANHNFNMVLRNGGTLYIDAGKPLPGQIETTVENLREVAPTMYFNVPGGYQALVPYLERDPALRDQFFSRLRFLFYAAASLPQPIWERLEALSEASVGHRVPMISSWGSTETAPLVTNVHYRIDRAGIIGLPVPGCEVKLVPTMDKLAVRIRGDNITPGYWKDEANTREAFDEEGYYKIGDAVRFADPDQPEWGLVFDGRLDENFKLPSGTWVDVGSLRLKVIEACAPVIQDAVITGHDRDTVGVLIFPSHDGCRAVSGESGESSLQSLLSHPKVHAHICAGLAEHNANNPGGSTRVHHALLMEEPPSMDAGEITDKGYINQAKVLERRAELVERLYENGEGVLRIERKEISDAIGK